MGSSVVCRMVCLGNFETVPVKYVLESRTDRRGVKKTANSSVKNDLFRHRENSAANFEN